jgi:hypothetical protein
MLKYYISDTVFAEMFWLEVFFKFGFMMTSLPTWAAGLPVGKFSDQKSQFG